MAKPVRSIDQLEQLQALLRNGDAWSAWQAGQLLEEFAGSNYGNGVFEQLARRLGGGTSAERLRRCRWLARTWPKDAAQEARRAKLGWGIALRLAGLDALAEKLENQDARALRRERSRLIRAKASKRITFAGMAKEIARLRQRHAPASVINKRVALELRTLPTLLGETSARLKRLAEMLPKGSRGQAKRLARKLKEARKLLRALAQTAG